MEPIVRSSGIHWGTGEDASSDILRYLPGAAPTVINEPEAQWHYAQIASNRSGLTVWRSSPSVKPAAHGFNGHAYSREIFKSIDAHYQRTGRNPVDIMLLNELNLNYERGDNESDIDPGTWVDLYSKLSVFLRQLLASCRERANDRGFTPRFWFQAWAPGHGEMSNSVASLWVPVAAEYDGITLHGYGDVETITETVEWYASTFPDHSLLLGEWNTINLGGDWRSQDGPGRERLLELRVGEERRIRARLARLCELYPQLSCTYFIYRWAEDNSREHDIEGHPLRESLWREVIAPDDYRADEQTADEQPTEDRPVEPDPMRDAMIGNQILTADELHAKRWQLHALDRLPSPPAFNSGAGFERHWRKPENAWWGSPVTVNEDTVKFDDGTMAPARVFTNAVIVYRADDSVMVLE